MFRSNTRYITVYIGIDQQQQLKQIIVMHATDIYVYDTR